MIDQDFIIIRIYSRYYNWLLFVLAVGAAVIPWWLFGEEWIPTFYTCVCAPLTINHNITCLVNSVAHLNGCQPYDM